jgi:uncharacterized surface anchored protein
VRDELIHFPITITKTDVTGENTLSGALIEVRNEAGEVIYRAYTDETGTLPDIPVTPGKYTFREILAPSGYAISEAEMTFTVDESGGVTGDTIIRDDYTRVTLLKQDETGLPLPGVEFLLAQDDGSLQLTAISDGSGLVTFERIPYGEYTITESVPLSGYMKSDVSIHLTVDGSFVNPIEPIASIKNEPLRVRGIKVDTSGTCMPGVEFSLIDAETDEIAQVTTSNEQGGFLFEKFPHGDWLIRETGVPEGFHPMEDIPLHVDETWMEPEPILCVNIPNHYAFVKVDGDGNPLAGVTFSLEDSEGNVLRDLVSGEDGIVQVTDLVPGTYIIREIETLDGFTRTDETIEVVIDEQYVVPEEMYQLVNYSGIQTGFDFEMTPVMWGGTGLMLAGVAIMAVNAVKGKRKKRRRHPAVPKNLRPRNP